MPWPTAPDDELFGLIDREVERQNATVHLIASDNVASPAVLRATGSVLGTPAVTTQGMREPEMARIAELTRRVLARRDDEGELAAVRDEVAALCSKYAPYPT